MTLKITNRAFGYYALVYGHRHSMAEVFKIKGKFVVVSEQHRDIKATYHFLMENLP